MASPKAIYRALKEDKYSLIELAGLFDKAYPTGFDPDDPDHVLLKKTITLKESEYKYKAKTEAEKAAKDERATVMEAGREYAYEHGLPETISEDALYEIGKLVLAEERGDTSEEEGTLAIVETDDDNRVLVLPSGEVVGFLDAPKGDDREKILEWVGEQITQREADIGGLEAERKIWLDKINATYDSRIRKHKQAQSSLRWIYGPMAESYLKEVMEKTGKRSVYVGLLKLAYTKSRESLDVLIPAKAVEWLRSVGKHDAIKVEESVVKSNVPPGLREKINEDFEATGMRVNPAGVDKFSMS